MVELYRFTRTQLFGNYVELNSKFCGNIIFRTLSGISLSVTVRYIYNLLCIYCRCKVDKKADLVFFPNNLLLRLVTVDNYQTARNKKQNPQSAKKKCKRNISK